MRDPKKGARRPKTKGFRRGEHWRDDKNGIDEHRMIKFILWSMAAMMSGTFAVVAITTPTHGIPPEPEAIGMSLKTSPIFFGSAAGLLALYSILRWKDGMKGPYAPLREIQCRESLVYDFITDSRGRCRNLATMHTHDGAGYCDQHPPHQHP